MSPPIFRKNDQPNLPQSSAHQSSSTSKRQSIMIAGCAILSVGATTMVTGCQSNPTVSSSAAVSGKMIDFETADTVQSQAQGRAFNASLHAKSERYVQLFDQEKYPSTENQAKSHLLTAIRQHLATEHVSVSQANYQAAPFISPDSIDAGASSLLKTILETYVYKKETSGDYESDYDSDNGDFYESESDYDGYVDAADEVVVEEYAEESDDIAYDENGYDENGYDWYGYDDEGYDQDGYDENGYSRSDYAAESYETDDYESDSAFSKLSELNPKSMTEQYEAMQMAKQQAEMAGTASAFPPESASGVLGQMLSMIHRTPEQIAASNEYQYKNLMFSSVSQYNPKQRQIQSVYSYDYVTPTISASVQIPLALDFDNSRITVDPSVIMPIMAIANPDHTPLPNEMASHTVSFGLPESITEQLPPAVLYDAAISAIQDSMAELAPEHFSAVDIRNDRFAKEVGASRAVKVYFGSQQSGEMIGKTLKYMSKSLQDYVDANPEKYPDGAMLKTAIDKLQLYNKGYQSADVGSLLQLIEAIGPISFNQINYYYLDSSDRLLAKQQRMNIGGDLMGSTTTVLNQVRYDKTSFKNHVLTPLLAESFGENAKPAIDGNAWMAEQHQAEDRLDTARYARYDYDSDYTDASDDYASDASEYDSSDDYDYDYDYDTDYSEDYNDAEDDTDNR
ncbi:hypothetical protein I6E84_02895 [Psychrobacter sp. SCQQ22]|uniref:hypothetical protein n=1 Tax=Psychrobacter sp. SCQQ22 TaxID=2792059 RepID=UPI0018CFD03B|nr:hypothetical protein [Psychrobacter sp. SCQQ22]MBH0085161.1 hypothetical protein [Psychrobacter sp. SCQQ22]